MGPDTGYGGDAGTSSAGSTDFGADSDYGDFGGGGYATDFGAGDASCACF